MISGLCLTLVLVVVFFGTLRGYYFLLESMYPERIRTNEKHYVSTPDLWQIRLCRHRAGRVQGEPVLLVHGFVSNQTLFTEPPKQCLVDYLVNRGFDCWCIELRGTRSSRAPFGQDLDAISLEDYILKDLPAAIKHIQKMSGHSQVHWVGHSMGGMLLYAYAQHFGTEELASGVTLGSPVDASGRDGVNLPNLSTKFARFWPAGAAYLFRGFVPIGVRFGFGSWVSANFDNLPSGAGTHLFFNMFERPSVRVLDQITGVLLNESLTLMDGNINLREAFNSLKLPLLFFCGQRDPFLTPRVAQDLDASAADGERILRVLSMNHGCHADYAHLDLLIGKNAAKEVFEPIADWVEAHPANLRPFQEEADEDRPIKAPMQDAERMALLDRDLRETIRTPKPPAKKVVAKPAPAPKKPAVAPKKAAPAPKKGATKPKRKS